LCFLVKAWELYLKIEGTQEAFAMLQLLANDCYRAGAFLYSAKAFETLERLDPNPEYWEVRESQQNCPSYTIIILHCERSAITLAPFSTLQRPSRRWSDSTRTRNIGR